MNNVVSLQLARERVWQPRGGSDGHAFKTLGLWNSETTELNGENADNQRLLERLEAENVQLRSIAMELVLQIQALRDGTLTA